MQVDTTCSAEPFATQYYLQLSPICNVKAVLLAAVQAVDSTALTTFRLFSSVLDSTGVLFDITMVGTVFFQLCLVTCRHAVDITAVGTLFIQLRLATCRFADCTSSQKKCFFSCVL